MGNHQHRGYDTYYYRMMQWLTGATFTASCPNSGTVWTCPLTEAGGANALIVWNTVGDSDYASRRVHRLQVLQRHLWRGD
jgi:hypothetical protein